MSKNRKKQSHTSSIPRRANHEQPGQPEKQPSVVLEKKEFKGILPPPEYLEYYDRILPGAAERIIAMAEKQAEHRQFLEKEDYRIGEFAIRKEFQQRKWGQIFAFLLFCSL
jgi:uncharacterized membrane protein